MEIRKIIALHISILLINGSKVSWVIGIHRKINAQTGYVKLIMYFFSTFVCFLVSLIPLESVLYVTLKNIIHKELAEIWLMLFLAPVTIVAAYIFSLVIFIVFHSQLVCKLLPRVQRGKFAINSMEGKVYATALTRDSIAKRLIEVLDWIPFITQKYLKPVLLRFYGLKTGKNVYIATQTYIDSSLTSIGSNTFIGHRALISNHLNENGFTVIDRVKIGENCVIGGLTLISPGVEIGDNVTIGAKSFVPKNKKLPSNTIWFGIPVREYKNEKNK